MTKYLYVIALSYAVALCVVAPAVLLARLMQTTISHATRLRWAGWCACGVVLIAWVGRLGT